MKRLLILGAWCVLLPAQAEFKDGNKLLSEINGNQSERLVSVGYVMGVADALNGVTFCGPYTVTAGQIFDMVKQYLELYPENRHHSADRIINQVLKTAWPCAKSGRGT